MAFKHLFSPLRLTDRLTLQSRIVVGPMTRSRADPITFAPTAHNAQYYEARTPQGGMVISEATAPAFSHRGYARQPGIYTNTQIDGWRRVSNAVKKREGSLWVQLLHAGRMVSSKLINDIPTVSAWGSAAPEGYTYLLDGTKAPFSQPNEATTQMIEQITQEFVQGARNSLAAGADGIQLHFANGYLLHEWIAAETNRRTDNHGGSVENRLRWPLSLIDQITQSIGSDRVAVRISPGITFSALKETKEQILETYPRFLQELSTRNLAFLEVADWNTSPQDGSRFVDLDIYKLARENYSGILIANGGIQPARAEELIESKIADAVSFASLFLSHPDLPERIKQNAPIDPYAAYQVLKQWYGPPVVDKIDYEADAKGYTDWPKLDGTRA